MVAEIHPGQNRRDRHWIRVCKHLLTDVMISCWDRILGDARINGLDFFQVAGEKEEDLKRRQIIQPSAAGDAEHERRGGDKNQNGLSNQGYALDQR